jgi:hypothetical protein
VSGKNPARVYAKEFVGGTGLTTSQAASVAAAVLAATPAADATGTVFGDVAGGLLGPLMVQALHGDEASAVLPADVNDYDLGDDKRDAFYWLIDFAGFDISGFAAPGTPGELHCVVNTGTAGSILASGSASAAENRVLSSAGDVAMATDAAVLVGYSGTLARWVLLGGASDLPLIETLPTAETNSALVLKPNGAGGVHWVAMASGLVAWVTVTDPAFGAVQNGTTNDRAAANLAIAALNAAGGGRLYFPASSAGCLISGGGLDPITVPCIVMGDGLRVSKILSDSRTANLLSGSANGVEFENLEIANTASLAPTAGAAIATTNSTLDRFRNLYITGFYTGIDIEDSLLWDGDHLYIEAFRKYGIRVRNTAVPDAGDWSLSNVTWSSAHAADACLRVESSGGGKVMNYKANSGGTAGNRPITGIDVAVGTGVATSILLLTNGSIENVDGDAIRVVATGAGAYQIVKVRQLEVLLPNSTGFVLKASGSGISLIDVDDVTASTSGTARAAISSTSVAGLYIGPQITLAAGFNAIFTNSGVTSFVDNTGTIAAGVRITGTPASGDVPIASSGTSAAWGAPSPGAPTGADYLVGTAQGALSAEIVVGTTPGGELGGTWPSPTVDTTHSGSSHAATQAAAEATAAAALAAALASLAVSLDHEHIGGIQFNGDGVTTAFELPAAPFDANAVAAYVAGVRLDVTLSGTMLTTMTFGSAPASGTGNIIVDVVAAAA